MLGKAVTPGLHGHLVRAVMGVGGKLGPLARFKIQYIGPFRRAFVKQQISRLANGGRIEAEGGVARLAAGDGLENEVAGRPRPDRLHLGSHMGQNTNLRRNGPTALFHMELLHHQESILCFLLIYEHRILNLLA